MPLHRNPTSRCDRAALLRARSGGRCRRAERRQRKGRRPACAARHRAERSSAHSDTTRCARCCRSRPSRRDAPSSIRSLYPATRRPCCIVPPRARCSSSPSPSRSPCCASRRAELSEARRFQTDSLVTIGFDPRDRARRSRSHPAYTQRLVDARRSHVEDWIAFLLANHLFAGADAYVAAHLWDLPSQISVERDPPARSSPRSSDGERRDARDADCRGAARPRAGNSAPIGVFDSGLGGLTVAHEIMRQLPSESLVYFGDTARVPYGPKSPDTVRRYSREIAHSCSSRA